MTDTSDPEPGQKVSLDQLQKLNPNIKFEKSLDGECVNGSKGCFYSAIHGGYTTHRCIGGTWFDSAERCNP